MSYNIDSFKVKKIDNFYIPNIRKILDELEDKEPEIFEVVVNEIDDRIMNIRMHGEFTGTFWHETFKDILKTSKGYLKALMVWEGGDTVEWIEINNGNIKYIDIIEDEDE